MDKEYFENMAQYQKDIATGKALKRKPSLKSSRSQEPSVSSQSSLYPTCDKIWGKPAFEMVEDYLEAGYYDEAINELNAMAGIIKHKYPARDKSKHHGS